MRDGRPVADDPHPAVDDDEEARSRSRPRARSRGRPGTRPRSPPRRRRPRSARPRPRNSGHPPMSSVTVGPRSASCGPPDRSGAAIVRRLTVARQRAPGRASWGTVCNDAGVRRGPRGGRDTGGDRPWPRARRSPTSSRGSRCSRPADAAAPGRRRARSRRSFFPEGERVLRQGLTGSGFYVILDGDGGRPDRRHRSAATLHRGDFFGEVSILLGEPPTADIVATTPLRCLAMLGPSAVEPLPARPPAGDVPDAPGPGPPAAQRQPLAELSAWPTDRRGPFPPGRVPGDRRRLRPRRAAAVVRAAGARRRARGASRRDAGPGGMFRRWPFFQRLLSWTKPYAPGPRRDPRVPALRLEQPARRRARAARRCRPSSSTARRTSRRGPAMQANLEAFAERAGIAVRYGTRWESTRREDGPGRHALRGRDDRRRVPLPDPRARRGRRGAVAARARPASSSPRHYAETRDAASYAGKRVFIIGKQNSGFELASGLAQWASSITVCSPSPAKTSDRDAVAGRRPGPLRPAVRGQLPGPRGADPRRRDHGRSASVEGGIRVDLSRTDTGEDAVRRGRRGDRRDRASPARCATCPSWASRRSAQARLPAVTPLWESATVPGIYFAGTISQASPGLRKHGMPANSGRRPRRTATTPGSSPDTSRRRASAGRSSGRSSALASSSRTSSARRPRRPSCGTRRRTSRGSSRSDDGRDPATMTGSCRSSTRSTA